MTYFSFALSVRLLEGDKCEVVRGHACVRVGLQELSFKFFLQSKIV
jgi:hypothetical protein